MPANIQLDPTLAKVIPATLGALVSLGFLKGSIIERISMTVGGVALAYYATPPSAVWLNATTSEGAGLVGFVIGLFGMTLVSKLYEALNALDAKTLGADIVETLKKRLGIGPSK